MTKPDKIIEHPTELGVYKIGIFQDSDPINPRGNDNLGTMAYKHRSYILGDEEISDPDDFIASLAGVDWDDEQFEGMDYKLTRDLMMGMVRDKYILLPLYIYDHSGVTMRTEPFSCRWDSGQVGWIYYDKSRNEHEGYTKEWLDQYHPGKSIDEVIESMLRAEVKEFDQYLTGDAYGMELFRPEDEIALGYGFNSCWGFFGRDWKENGLLDHAIPSINADVNKRLELKAKQIRSHCKYLKSMIRSKCPIQYRKKLNLNY